MLQMQNFVMPGSGLHTASIGLSHPAFLTMQPVLLQSLPFNAASWLPVAFAAVLLVFGVAGLVYMIGYLVGSPTARSWSRMQIYEALLSLVMILIFVALSSLFMLKVSHAYSSAGLLPTSACSSASDIYAISACDLAYFNSNAGDYFITTYYAATVIGSADPNLAFKLSVPNMYNISASANTDILPRDFESMVGILFVGIITMLLLNQVQTVLLSGSLLFLAFFLVLGLIARTLGFSRRFGGAMIAFGLGLGLVYPLITSLTYGYIDASLSPLSFLGTAGALAGATLGFVFDPTGAAGLAFAAGLGYIIAGLTFIPFLNFTILEAFITDFSSAIGERVSFMALLSTVV
ncbi:MAG: hypothetical protein M1500_00285 [Candidatus Marsarchaeota archaeon]|nr:hypothetical protein [Candidatus Marsarchaeota archaeon]MCL5112144.1 hypothetical protein [Candidatus Marsarchaeota archaeon]